MKLLKTLSIAALAAAFTGTAASAAAVNVIHVVGSTAFRSATTIAIIDTLAGTTAGGGTGHTQVFGGTDTAAENYTGASHMIFANGTIGSSGTATTIIEATWTGSLAGVVDLAAQTSTALFFDETQTAVQTYVNANPITAGTYEQTAAAQASALSSAGSNTHSVGDIEMAMSDSYKQTISKELATGSFSSGTTHIGTFSSVASLASATNSTNIVDAGTGSFAGGSGVVAIVPFELCVGKVTGGQTFSDSSSYTLPSSLTQQSLSQAITSGYIPQQIYTGGTTLADTQNWLFWTGRNEDSGTRIGYLMESQFGVTTSPVQWEVPGDGVTTQAQYYPITALNTEPGIVWNTTGHSGYSSGGTVQSALDVAETGTVTFGTNPTTSQSWQPSDATGNLYFFSSLGLTDGLKEISLGGKSVAYNGVAFSPAAVQNGTYTLWEFEHCYRQKTSSVSATIDKIADNLFASDADVVFPAGGVQHTENPTTGVYSTIGGQIAPGVKFDAFCNFSRPLTEGQPVGPQY